MFNITRFYSWLQYNDHTPFFVKLNVLYGCLFSSILYSCEAWGDLNKIENLLRSTELKALKCCLGVKSGTSSDIIFTEINSPDIIATIKDRQYQFRKKINNLKKGEALMKEIWDLCQLQENENLCHYYMNIPGDNAISNIRDRKSRIEVADQTMCVRYRTLIGFSYAPILYQSCLDDELRKVITRWRLSSHKLKIETGRYTVPKTLLVNRKCKMCGVIEDEQHAIYECDAHRLIRDKFKNQLDLEHVNLPNLFNPITVSDATILAKYLTKIEKNMEDLDMI